ncbi:hypothetical protein [Pseudoalteromonas ardens]|uniref:Uncharacterized protein n=1 Tax=Pseudoalteromonas rubra TaxID=43658 RepID=A0A0L0EVY0_9GAMM|nr:hypothetical protein [Pseudoalteromonas sp. R96]KNC68596.1 hypothetical protein AC626_03920 [Pseudoalteromonas rubra]MDK1312514.1 hypothetical protein [Pseudoalteromonas sp. R96]
MKKILLLLTALSAFSVSAGEVWRWNTKVKALRTYGGGFSQYACFTIEANAPSLCFDLEQPGGKEKYSTLLTAKVAGLPVDVSYYDDRKVPVNFWFSNQLAFNIWLR